MNTEDQLNRAHAESLTAHSRENEDQCICDDCPHQDDCVMSPGICEGLASERAADDAIKARKERDL